MTISTREQLRDHIHSIHDFLRNNGAGYGLQAMTIFKLFYGLKIMEPVLSDPKCKYDKNLCKFSNLVKMIDTHQPHEIKERVINILKELSDETKDPTGKMKYYVYNELPNDFQNEVWIEIIKNIDAIPVKNNKQDNSILDEKFDVDLSGKVYEYFIGRDATAISELGAYFTDRHITKYVIDKVKPTTFKDGIVKSMIDPFGGSGGFTLGYADYLNKEKHIDWKKENNKGIPNYQKIYHLDMSEAVIKIAGLEYFGLTGRFPELDSTCRTFERGNTFKKEFASQFDYIFTNPPYGGDKSVKKPEVINNEKIIEHIKGVLQDRNKSYLENEEYVSTINKIKLKGKHKKNIIDYSIEQLDEIIEKLDDGLDNLQELLLKIQSNLKQIKLLNKKNNDMKEEQISKQVNYDSCSDFIQKYIDEYKLTNCNDKEACSLVLLMALLKEKGTCAGVLKEGVFFDRKYSSIRGHLIKNFNVKYIVSIPQDQFENTSTKTSVIIFDNTPDHKTQEIIFYDLDVIKEENDVFEELEDWTIELTNRKGDIIEVKEREVCRASYDELVKGDSYSLNAKDYISKEIIVNKDFTAKKLGDLCKINPETKIKLLDENNYVEIGDIQYNEIINVTKLAKENVPSGAKRSPIKNDILVCSVRPNSKKVVYLCNDLLPTNLIMSGAINVLRNTNIICQQYIYTYIISKLDETLKKMSNGSNYPRISPDTLNDIQIPFPNDITKFEPILNKLMKCHKMKSELESSLPQKEKAICDLIKKLTDEGKEGVDYDSHKLGDVCEFQSGKFNTNKKTDTGEYPFYNASMNNPIGTHNEYCFDGDKYILLIKSGNVKANGIGSVMLVSGKIAGVSDLIKITTHNYDIQYVFYYLKNIKQLIKESMNTTVGLGHLSLNEIKLTIIEVIRPQIMKKHKIQELFDEVDKMREDIETNKSDYEKLSNEFMLMIDPNYKKDESNVVLNNVPDVKSNDEPFDEIEEIKPTKKITVKKVIKKKSKIDSNDDI